MQTAPLQRSPPPQGSDAIATNSDQSFVETLEYKRFIEFCDACRQYRYIGLCVGPPGVGKTLSALRYSRNEILDQLDPWSANVQAFPPLDTLLYTPAVMNSPPKIDSDLRRARETIAGLVRRPLRREAHAALAVLRERDDMH